MERWGGGHHEPGDDDLAAPEVVQADLGGSGRACGLTGAGGIEGGGE